MKKYIFTNSKNNSLEEIKLKYFEEDKIHYQTIGDIYNVISYIDNNIDDYAEIEFLYFTIDKLNYIISSIPRYKKITKINAYNNIEITKKKKIRGR